MYWMIWTILFLAALLLIFMVKEAFHNRVKKEELAFPDFPKQWGELTIFFISDIHKRLVHETIIQNIKGKADIVVIGGDLTEGGVPLSRTRKNIEMLQQAAPVFFIWGNNDYEINTGKLNKLFRECGVTVLKNEAAFLQKGESSIALIGLDDHEPSEPSLRAILHSLDDRHFKILLSHKPFILDAIRKSDNIALVLSGHTHGGQIRLFGFGPYQRGRTFHHFNTTILISNGYGTTLLPLRLGAPAETHLVTIKHAEGQK
ncbi:metallophosphoesterase [Siminovitchia sp. 179-K 8D1 HS]|uniref:metallophosphoesterase n=1 Tax=Siminovitchia sp. 179-K 8D1 HS TaxID=3142385 RepID=UPI0039A0F436